MRNTEGGTKVEPGKLTAHVDSAYRGREEGKKPHGRRSLPKGTSKHRQESSEGGRRSREDEPAIRGSRGTVSRKDRIGPPEMARQWRDRSNPTAPVPRYRQHSAGQQTPRETAARKRRRVGARTSKGKHHVGRPAGTAERFSYADEGDCRRGRDGAGGHRSRPSFVCRPCPDRGHPDPGHGRDIQRR